eukprot:1769500-Rhodomonas_salina.2
MLGLTHASLRVPAACEQKHRPARAFPLQRSLPAQVRKVASLRPCYALSGTDVACMLLPDTTRAA